MQTAKLLTRALLLGVALAACSSATPADTNPTSATVDDAPGRAVVMAPPFAVPVGYKAANRASFTLVIPESWTIKTDTVVGQEVIFRAGSEEGAASISLLVSVVPESTTATQVAETITKQMVAEFGSKTTVLRGGITLPAGDFKTTTFTVTGLGSHTVTSTLHVKVHNRTAVVFTTTAREGENVDTLKTLTQSMRFK